MQEVKKVVVIGPESTGKSTLCKLLARHYNTLWCPEYAREYLLKNDTNYTFENLLDIAKGQIALEEEYTEKVSGQWAIGNSEWSMVNGQWSMMNGKEGIDNNQPKAKSQEPTANSQKPTACPLLFLDTDMYVMKVWCEFVFNACHQFIVDEIVNRKYDLYLLCSTDLPWVKDELREYPDLETREKLFHIYRDILINQHVPWVEIKGDYFQRLQSAILATNGLLASSRL